VRGRAVDAARDEHDLRVKEATAEALVTLEARRETEQASSEAARASAISDRGSG
jgi:hypothetical protein